MHHHAQNGNHPVELFHKPSFTISIFSIVSPSNYEKRRELADRKDSITEDQRTNTTGVNMKKSGTDNTRPPLKSSLFFVFDLNERSVY